MSSASLALWLPMLLGALAAGILIGRYFFSRPGNPGSARSPNAGEAGDSENAGLILKSMDDVAWVYDIASNCITYVSPSVERQRGWKVEEILGRSAQDMAPGLEPERISKLLRELKARDSASADARSPDRIQTSVPLKDGRSAPIETIYRAIPGPEGQPLKVLGVSRDITERLQVEQRLRESEERVRLALQCSGDGVWDLDMQSRRMTYLEGWERVLGFKENELEPSFDAYLALIHHEDRDKLLAEIKRHVDGDRQSYQCEFRIRAKDGGWRWVLSRGLLWSRTEAGKPLRLIGTHTDITSRKVAEVAMSRTNAKLHTQIDEIQILQSQLAEQAVRDPLTGLYNRRYLDETLEREVARARREGHPLSVVMLDVDLFKKLNDSYGHQAGDEVLKALGELLREDTRAEDVACRYGGEEFLVLLPSMPLEKARERAEHWRQQLEKRIFEFGNFSLSVTASFGVSGYPLHGKTPDDLTRAADSALYSAKHRGRNRVEVYDEAPIFFVTGDPQLPG